jgi:SAM-dependent methyltransferase
MTRVFGEVASIYDDVRPGYPEAVRRAITDFAGRPPATVAELGAGTGKATEVLAGFGVPYTAVEPDPRMAAVLRAKFPAIEVVGASFEEWAPPATGFGLITCGMAWHWMEPETRNRRAFDALAPGGTLAILMHTYDYAEAAEGRAIDEFLNRINPQASARDEHWALADVTAPGIWPVTRERVWHTYPTYSKARFLALTETFSSVRRLPPAVRQQILDGLGALLEGFGGEVTLDLATTLTLARRPD